MWRRKRFPWQRQEAREEKPGEEGEGERGGGVTMGGAGEGEAAGQRGRGRGSTERWGGGIGIWGLRLSVVAEQGGEGQDGWHSDPHLPSTGHQRGQSSRDQ